MNAGFADRISTVCHEKYNSLPNRGKPIKAQSEWTLMSAILYTKDTTREPVVVAMGTGSKCLGKSKMSLTGNIINDSHAEVMARRAFICYLLDELIKMTRGEESEVLEQCSERSEFRCELKEGVQFHMYSSHTPCGDASIFPKQPDSDLGDVVKKNTVPSPISQKRTMDSSDLCSKRFKKGNLSKSNDTCREHTCTCTCRSGEITLDQRNTSAKLHSDLNCALVEKFAILDPENEKLSSDWLPSVDQSRQRLSNADGCDAAGNNAVDLKTDENSKQNQTDIFRTGAKCVPGGLQDPKGIGSNYHCVGALRIKPGRGDRTISMSCSDKIARWNVVGCQGALLYHFLKSPIYLKTLIIGRCPYDQAAMDRALVDRICMVEDLPSGYNVNKMEFYQSSQRFCGGKEALEEGMNLIEGRVQLQNKTVKPSPNALVWYLGSSKGVEVTVNGRKQGVTSKNIDKPAARCFIFAQEIFKNFHGLLSAVQEDSRPHTLRNLDPNSNYWEFKSAATSYQTAVNRLKQVFSLWISKPRDHLQFTCCNG